MRFVVVAAALLGFSSVVMGAAGDHLLAASMTSDMTERFAVALHYHQLYSIVILVLGLYGIQHNHGKFYVTSCGMFIAGTLVFSASLYLSIFLGVPALTYGTPLGGILLMGAWLSLSFDFLNYHKNIKP